ncbi:hypothetical protein DHEL01_v202174 [Diaporthe helianthi]|uniref:Uncharacterized protein n=1 Tax=Diaporthe helianthi TaxID=158607 RepID=A0A2P5IAD3_DIAHE|nr:hypothetical protein DHEL01_v202174 [Diaporthe helianthi]
MGGKVWSDVEEEIFWTVLARRAPPGFHKESKAKKKSHHELAKSWAPLIDVMKSLMLEKNPGMTEDDLPRSYSAISIYEHWFQNLVQGKLSPHAGRHVRAHQEWLKEVAEEPESGQLLSSVMVTVEAIEVEFELAMLAQGRAPAMSFENSQGRVHESVQEWQHQVHLSQPNQQWFAHPDMPFR